MKKIVVFVVAAFFGMAAANAQQPVEKEVKAAPTQVASPHSCQHKCNHSCQKAETPKCDKELVKPAPQEVKKNGTAKMAPAQAKQPAKSAQSKEAVTPAPAQKNAQAKDQKASVKK